MAQKKNNRINYFDGDDDDNTDDDDEVISISSSSSTSSNSTESENEDNDDDDDDVPTVVESPALSSLSDPMSQRASQAGAGHSGYPHPPPHDQLLVTQAPAPFTMSALSPPSQQQQSRRDDTRLRRRRSSTGTSNSLGSAGDEETTLDKSPPPPMSAFKVTRVNGKRPAPTANPAAKAAADPSNKKKKTSVAAAQQKKNQQKEKPPDAKSNTAKTKRELPNSSTSDQPAGKANAKMVGSNNVGSARNATTKLAVAPGTTMTTSLVTDTTTSVLECRRNPVISVVKQQPADNNNSEKAAEPQRNGGESSGGQGSEPSPVQPAAVAKATKSTSTNSSGPTKATAKAASSSSASQAATTPSAGDVDASKPGPSISGNPTKSPASGAARPPPSTSAATSTAAVAAGAESNAPKKSAGKVTGKGAAAESNASKTIPSTGAGKSSAPVAAESTAPKKTATTGAATGAAAVAPDANKGKPSSAAAAGAPATKKLTFQDTVYLHMMKHMKPFLLKDLAKELKSSETALQYVMLSLVDKNLVSTKEFASAKKFKNLYWANHDVKSKDVASVCYQASESEMQAARNQLSQLQAQFGNLQAELARVLETHSNDDLSSILLAQQADLDQARERLAVMKSRIQQQTANPGILGRGNAPMVRVGGVGAASRGPTAAVPANPKILKARINRMIAEHKRRKQLCMDFVDNLADGMDKKPKDVVALLDLETDEAALKASGSGAAAVLPAPYPL